MPIKYSNKNNDLVGFGFTGEEVYVEILESSDTDWTVFPFDNLDEAQEFIERFQFSRCFLRSASTQQRSAHQIEGRHSQVGKTVALPTIRTVPCLGKKSS